MTIQQLESQTAQIRSLYLQNGGLESMFDEFIAVLKEAIEFELIESDNTEEIVKEWLKPRFKGIEEKKSIADVVSSINEKRGLADKTYNPLAKKYE